MKNHLYVWKKKDVIVLLERLEMYISAGLSIESALSLIQEGLLRKQMNTMELIRSSFISGNLLSKAFTLHSKLPQIFTTLLENGEYSGDIAHAMCAAKAVLEREEELKKKCASALMYPMVIGVFAALLTIGLVRGVMPQIIPMLLSLHVELPLLTRIVIVVSNIVVSYGIYILIGLGVLTALAVSMYKKIQIFKSYVQSVFLQVPLIGNLRFNYSLSVFLRSSGSLIESGIAVERAFKQGIETMSLLPFRMQLSAKSALVSRGTPLAAIIQGKRIPAFVTSLIRAGEVTGTLADSMTRAAQILDSELRHSLDRMTALIEPIMMIGMGSVVGSIAISIMLPIYDISKVLQK